LSQISLTITILKIPTATRRGHRRQAKRLHRKSARRRADALHKFSRRIVDQYETIVVGDVSSQKLVRTRMAKSVLDSSWATLKRMLQYKGEHAGRSVVVVSERNTTRACSVCGALLGPTGMDSPLTAGWLAPRPADRLPLLVVLSVQLRHGRRESSEQTVDIIVDSRREEQRGAR
jgi:IS605 OrfB family transposase